MLAGVNFLEKGSPSQALPRQLSQRESQAVKFSAKVLGAKRNFPAVDLALPLGELAKPQALTERAQGARTPQSAALTEGVPDRQD